MVSVKGYVKRGQAHAPVVALDSENYMVGSHGVLGNGSAAEERAKAVQAATDFCKAKSRAVQVDHIESVDPFFGRAPAVDVRFQASKSPVPERTHMKLSEGVAIAAR